MQGIDVSEHDGFLSVDFWQALKNDGLEFAIVRSGFSYPSEGGRQDYYFENNISACEQLGIPVGVYHYSYASTYDGGQLEADYALSIVRDHKLTLPVFIDVEEQSKASTSHFVCNGFCDRVASIGYGCGIYASESWWAENLLGKIYGPAKDGTRWVANWSHRPDIPFDIWQTGSKEWIDRSFDANVTEDKPCLVLDELVDRTIAGEFGNGDSRKTLLGPLYDIVQSAVNAKLS